jgi:hypothetical protein
MNLPYHYPQLSFRFVAPRVSPARHRGPHPLLLEAGRRDPQLRQIGAPAEVGEVRCPCAVCLDIDVVGRAPPTMVDEGGTVKAPLRLTVDGYSWGFPIQIRAFRRNDSTAPRSSSTAGCWAQPAHGSEIPFENLAARVSRRLASARGGSSRRRPRLERAGPARRRRGRTTLAWGPQTPPYSSSGTEQEKQVGLSELRVCHGKTINGTR